MESVCGFSVRPRLGRLIRISATGLWQCWDRASRARAAPVRSFCASASNRLTTRLMRYRTTALTSPMLPCGTAFPDQHPFRRVNARLEPTPQARSRCVQLLAVFSATRANFAKRLYGTGVARLILCNCHIPTPRRTRINKYQQIRECYQCSFTINLHGTVQPCRGFLRARIRLGRVTSLSTVFGFRLKSSCDCWFADFAIDDTYNPNNTSYIFQLTLSGLGSLGTGSPFGKQPVSAHGPGAKPFNSPATGRG